MTFIYLIATWSLYAFFSVVSICLIIIARFYLTNGAAKLDKCGLYMGKVSHTRLKGGATHHFVYPLFFSFIDLQQISGVGWSLWPIFKLNGGSYSFCSLDEKDHLKDWTKEQENVNENIPSPRKSESLTLLQKVIDFIANRTKMTKKLPPECSISLLTHLTYFGYCFNPISVFYCLRPDSMGNGCGLTTSADGHKSVGTEDKNKDFINNKTVDEKKPSLELKDSPHVSKIESIIVEVSNTPWIEQHSYMLDESVEHVSVTRNVEKKNDKGAFQATWLKEFHVSPFMEMDYKYNFTFSEPKETVWVQSTMTKLSTNEVWFTVNFELNRVPFTPLNLLYVLLFYPFYTRVIQILIHYEAVKLFMKGIPTFNHPKGTPVEFGFGITDKKIVKFVSYMSQIWKSLCPSVGKTKIISQDKKGL